MKEIRELMSNFATSEITDYYSQNRYDMKIKSLLLFACLTALHLGAAVPGSFAMQAVATDGASVVANKDVKVRVSLRQGKATSKKVYVETHELATDGLGVLTFNVGEGKIESGDFASISWSGKDLFIEIEIDKGAGYVSAGTRQLTAVPFAKFANRAEKLVLSSASGKKFEVTIDDDGNLIANPIAE